MKKRLITLLITVVLLVTFVPSAYAQPENGCPPGFELHIMGSDHPEEGHHIGLKHDLIDGGDVCVKHLENGLHVHVDNVIPNE